MRSDGVGCSLEEGVSVPQLLPTPAGQVTFRNPVIERIPRLRRQKKIFSKQQGEEAVGCVVGHGGGEGGPAGASRVTYPPIPCREDLPACEADEHRCGHLGTAA